MAKYFDRGSPLNRSNQGQDPVRRVNRNRSLNPNIFDPNPQAQRSSMQGGLIPQGHPQKKHKVPFARDMVRHPLLLKQLRSLPLQVAHLQIPLQTPTQTATQSPTVTRSRTPTQTIQYQQHKHLHKHKPKHQLKQAKTNSYTNSFTNTYNSKRVLLHKQELLQLRHVLKVLLVTCTYKNTYRNNKQLQNLITQSVTRTGTPTCYTNTNRRLQYRNTYTNIKHRHKHSHVVRTPTKQLHKHRKIYYPNSFSNSDTYSDKTQTRHKLQTPTHPTPDSNTEHLAHNQHPLKQKALHLHQHLQKQKHQLQMSLQHLLQHRTKQLLYLLP